MPSDCKFKQKAEGSTEIVNAQCCTSGNAKMIKLMLLHTLYLSPKAVFLCEAAAF